MNGLEIKVLENREEMAVQMCELSQAVGWNHPLELSREIANAPVFSYMTGWLGERLVGGVGLVTYGRQGYVSMVMVKPEFQRKGVATQLLTALLDSHRECTGFRLNATAVGLSVYERLGFRKQWTTVCMGAKEPPVASPLPAGEVVPLTADEVEWAARRDRAVYGHDRTELIRYSVAVHPELAFRLRDRRAFVLGRQDGEFAQLAMLEADDDAAALALLGGVLRRLPPQSFFMFGHYVPSTRMKFMECLDQAGFRFGNTMCDMTLGKTEPPDISKYYLTFGGDFG